VTNRAAVEGKKKTGNFKLGVVFVAIVACVVWDRTEWKGESFGEKEGEGRLASNQEAG